MGDRLARASAVEFEPVAPSNDGEFGLRKGLDVKLKGVDGGRF